MIWLTICIGARYSLHVLTFESCCSKFLAQSCVSSELDFARHSATALIPNQIKMVSFKIHKLYTVRSIMVLYSHSNF